MAVAAAVLAAAIVASILLPLAKVSFPKTEELYVIYYGHLVDGSGNITAQARALLDARPTMVVIPVSFPDGQPNLTEELRKAFSDSGIKVIAYTWTDYGSRPLDDVTAEIDRVGGQADGIFVDEVTNIESDSEYSYYSSIYRHVKDTLGEQKLVIMNPGHYKVSEQIMKISDIVSLEEEWTYHSSIPWIGKYAPSRFMGVSSNEYCSQCISGENAAAKTSEAWASGIGYHFSTDRYIDLPPWFASYVSQAEETKEADSTQPK